MNKNVALLAIFISLILFIYWYEKKKYREAIIEYRNISIDSCRRGARLLDERKYGVGTATDSSFIICMDLWPEPMFNESGEVEIE